MKGVLFVLVGFLVSIYVLLIEVNLYSIQNHRNQLEDHYGRIIKQVLEEGYVTKEEDGIWEMMQERLSEVLGDDVEFYIDIQYVDLGQGILSASITEQIPLLSGQKKTITIDKTVIMDRKAAAEPMVCVKFQVGEIVYKEYQIVKGQECPLPLPPAGNFAGWKRCDVANPELITDKIGIVSEDRIYKAVIN